MCLAHKVVCDTIFEETMPALCISYDRSPFRQLLIPIEEPNRVFINDESEKLIVYPQIINAISDDLFGKKPVNGETKLEAGTFNLIRILQDFVIFKDETTITQPSGNISQVIKNGLFVANLLDSIFWLESRATGYSLFLDFFSSLRKDLTNYIVNTITWLKIPIDLLTDSMTDCTDETCVVCFTNPHGLVRYCSFLKEQKLSLGDEIEDQLNSTLFKCYFMKKRADAQFKIKDWNRNELILDGILNGAFFSFFKSENDNLGAVSVLTEENNRLKSDLEKSSNELNLVKEKLKQKKRKIEDLKVRLHGNEKKKMREESDVFDDLEF